MDDFGARFHASALGRFMTPDWDAKPMTVPYAKFGDPQTLNLYSYVENDPVNRADADGHQQGTIAPQDPGGYWLDFAPSYAKDLNGGGSSVIAEAMGNYLSGAAQNKVPPAIYSKLTKAATEFGVPLDVVLATVKTESSFNPDLTNKNKDGSTDYGLFQIDSSNIGGTTTGARW